MYDVVPVYLIGFLSGGGLRSVVDPLCKRLGRLRDGSMGTIEIETSSMHAWTDPGRGAI